MSALVSITIDLHIVTFNGEISDFTFLDFLIQWIQLIPPSLKLFPPLAFWALRSWALRLSFLSHRSFSLSLAGFSSSSNVSRYNLIFLLCLYLYLPANSSHGLKHQLCVDKPQIAETQTAAPNSRLTAASYC